MAIKLVYQPPKWEKEQKKELQLFRQSKGQDITLINLQRILKEEEEFPAMRNYQELYTNLQLKYRILAGSSYLRDSLDAHVVYYTYLSGMASVCAYLFNHTAPPEKRNDTDQKNIGYDFSYGLFQLFAVQSYLPPCLSSFEHPYVQLLLGNFEQAVELLSSTLPTFDATRPYAVLMNDAQRLTVQAMAEKNEKLLTDQLVQQVKAYRKQPVGYSTFVDAYSIAYIKLARMNNMSCNLDIIEIPEMFFDDTICKIDTSEIKLPFFDDALEQLKKLGFVWT